MKATFKRALISTALASAITFPALADSPNWNFVQGSYLKASIDGLDVEPSGFGITGSTSMSENVFLGAAYKKLSGDISYLDVEASQISIGIGYHSPLSDKTDVYAMLGFEIVEAKASGYRYSVSEDDTGYSFTVGLRSMVSESFELNGSVGYNSIDGENETSLAAGAQYYFNENVSIGAQYTTGDDTNMWGFTARYSF